MAATPLVRLGTVLATVVGVVVLSPAHTATANPGSPIATAATADPGSAVAEPAVTGAWAARPVAATPATVVRAVTVRPGDSLSSLGRRYHVPYRGIAAWNGLSAARPQAALPVDGLLRFAAAPAYPRFRSSIGLPAPKQLAAYWRPGCPVAASALRVVSMSYVGFDALPHTGTLMVNRSVTGQVSSAFRTLYAQRFPIESMAVDPAVDAAGISNTASYNCRPVRGTTTSWSQHAYGLAVDINPAQNPQVKRGTPVPPASRGYVNRSVYARGVVHRPGAVTVLRANGLFWGGLWGNQQDYMHFSTANR